MKTVRILSTIKHGGKHLPPCDKAIEMDDAKAAELEALGAVKILSEAKAKTDVSVDDKGKAANATAAAKPKAAVKPKTEKTTPAAKPEAAAADDGTKTDDGSAKE